MTKRRKIVEPVGWFTTYYVGCGCTMYLPGASSGARYDLPPPAPGAMLPPVPGANHYILCVPEKNAAGVFYARLLIRL